MAPADQPPTGDATVDPAAAPAEAFRAAIATESDATTVGDAASNPAPQDAASSKDVSMTDAPPESAASPAPANPASTPANAASPMPARTGTPMRNANGESGSRAASQHPDPGFTMPSEAPPHGAPTRQYLNSKVTGPLLEGMKQLAKDKPKDPLRVLGEFLIQRSKELESTS